MSSLFPLAMALIGDPAARAAVAVVMERFPDVASRARATWMASVFGGSAHPPAHAIRTFFEDENSLRAVAAFFGAAAMYGGTGEAFARLQSAIVAAIRSVGVDDARLRSVFAAEGITIPAAAAAVASPTPSTANPVAAPATPSTAVPATLPVHL